MPKQTLESLLQLAKRSCTWDAHCNGVITVTEHFEDCTYQNHSLMKTDVSAISEDLFTALHSFLTEKHKRLGQYSRVVGDSIIPTLKLHSGQTWEFKSERGRQIVLGRLDEMLVYLDDTDRISRVRLRGNQYLLSVEPPNIFNAVPHVISQNTNEMFVSVPDLTTRYPGWEQRWRVGVSIDMPMKDLMKHMFWSPHDMVATTTMSGIEFE